MNRFQRERYRKSRRTRAAESAEAVKSLGAWWKARKTEQLLPLEGAAREKPADVPERR